MRLQSDAQVGTGFRTASEEHDASASFSDHSALSLLRY